VPRRENRSARDALPLLQVTLTTDQQLPIARWLLKVAIMYEYIIGRSPRLFIPSDRKAFFESRAIPENTVMSLAHYVGRTSGLLTDNEAALSYELKGKIYSPRAHVFTMAIGRIAMQLFSLRWPDQLDTTTQLNSPIPQAWSEAVVDIWPIRGNRTWPPTRHLDDESVGYFAARWDVEPSRLNEIPLPLDVKR